MPRPRIFTISLAELRRFLRVQAGGRLVEQQQLRFGCQRPRQFHPPLKTIGRLPAGVCAISDRPTKSSNCRPRVPGRGFLTASQTGRASRDRPETIRHPAVADPAARSREPTGREKRRDSGRSGPRPGGQIDGSSVAPDFVFRGTGYVPSSGSITPVIMLIIVLLPAPFGPISAWM